MRIILVCIVCAVADVVVKVDNAYHILTQQQQRIFNGHDVELLNYNSPVHVLWTIPPRIASSQGAIGGPATIIDLYPGLCSNPTPVTDIQQVVCPQIVTINPSSLSVVLHTHAYDRQTTQYGAGGTTTTVN